MKLSVILKFKKQRNNKPAIMGEPLTREHAEDREKKDVLRLSAVRLALFRPRRL